MNTKKKITPFPLSSYFFDDDLALAAASFVEKFR